MEIMFQNQKQTAKITDFFTLGTPNMGQCCNTLPVFQNYGAKHSSERNSCVCSVQDQLTINYHIDISRVNVNNLQLLLP